jgi:hypothetical protein
MKKLSISVLGLSNKLRRLSTVGFARLHAALIGAYAPMLATRSDWQILGRFSSQLLEETEHFCGWPQEKVAKIVQCGEPKFPNKLKELRPLQEWPSVFCDIDCDVTFVS